ncbi:hypothetical protein KA005_42375 [bacterium]|nr:hypothetical protein [bacterium]
MTDKKKNLPDNVIDLQKIRAEKKAGMTEEIHLESMEDCLKVAQDLTKNIELLGGESSIVIRHGMNTYSPDNKIDSKAVVSNVLQMWTEYPESINEVMHAILQMKRKQELKEDHRRL